MAMSQTGRFPPPKKNDPCLVLRLLVILLQASWPLHKPMCSCFVKIESSKFKGLPRNFLPNLAHLRASHSDNCRVGITCASHFQHMICWDNYVGFLEIVRDIDVLSISVSTSLYSFTFISTIIAIQISTVSMHEYLHDTRICTYTYIAMWSQPIKTFRWLASPKSPAPRFDVRSLKGFHVLHGPHPWGKGALPEKTHGEWPKKRMGLGTLEFPKRYDFLFEFLKANSRPPSWHRKLTPCFNQSLSF